RQSTIPSICSSWRKSSSPSAWPDRVSDSSRRPTSIGSGPFSWDSSPMNDQLQALVALQDLDLLIREAKDPERATQEEELGLPFGRPTGPPIPRYTRHATTPRPASRRRRASLDRAAVRSSARRNDHVPGPHPDPLRRRRFRAPSRDEGVAVGERAPSGEAPAALDSHGLLGVAYSSGHENGVRRSRLSHEPRPSDAGGPYGGMVGLRSGDPAAPIPGRRADRHRSVRGAPRPLARL